MNTITNLPKKSLELNKNILKELNLLHNSNDSIKSKKLDQCNNKTPSSSVFLHEFKKENDLINVDVDITSSNNSKKYLEFNTYESYEIPPIPEIDPIFHIISNIFEIVYKELGPGYSEKIYENAICCELRHQFISYSNQVVIPIKYKNIFIGSHQSDILISYGILIEIKSVKFTPRLISQTELQLKRYMKDLNINSGFIVNFGADGNLYYRLIKEK